MQGKPEYSKKNPLEVLSNAEMQAADKKAISSGIAGEKLMETAGKAVTDEIVRRFKKTNILIACGPGNNGGDGFVIARLLKSKGWTVKVGLLGEASDLKGDALFMHKKLAKAKIKCAALSPALISGCSLAVDAIFGTGLKKEIKGEAKKFIDALNKSGIGVIAVDIPSGINGDNGEVMEVAVKADITVTFAKKKYGHLMLPGKAYAGEVVVTDIGITEKHIGKINAWENNPDLWFYAFPFPRISMHKYSRGHAVIVGGGTKKCGASKLASLAALRIGAGLVTIACPEDALPVYAVSAFSVMTEPVNDAQDFAKFIEDTRKNALLIGPGAGINALTKEYVMIALEQRKAFVMDADALSVFSDPFTNDAETLFATIKKTKTPVVLTPHEGEFSKLFRKHIDHDMPKIERAKVAAEISGAVVLLKGADTVIAAPDGRVVINSNAPAYLATAGSGDVLAGMITGLLAQGMDAFTAAAAACWIHGEAAGYFGIGLISSDLPDIIPEVLAYLEVSR